MRERHFIWDLGSFFNARVVVGVWRRESCGLPAGRQVVAWVDGPTVVFADKGPILGGHSAFYGVLLYVANCAADVVGIEEIYLPARFGPLRQAQDLRHTG